MPRLNSGERERESALAFWPCSNAGERKNKSRDVLTSNVSRSTIWRLVRRVRVTGTFADRPRSGRPRVTSVRQDNFICHRHLRDRFVTGESTSRLVVGNRGRPISHYTVRRRLRERGITCRRLCRSLVLTLRHRHQRLYLGQQLSRSVLAERDVQRRVAFQLIERQQAYTYVQATS
jgi:transposase